MRLTEQASTIGRHSDPITLISIEVDDVIVAEIMETNGDLRRFCKRCGGSGRYSFNRMDGTVCYGCNGDGIGEATTVEREVRLAEQRTKRQEATSRKAKREHDRREATLRYWLKENAELWADLSQHLPFASETAMGTYREPAETFLAKLAIQVEDERKPLTDRQVEAARRALVQDAERKAAKAERQAEQAGAGHWGTVGKRETVAVEIIALRSFDSDYGTRWLVTMKTDEGHILKTWTSGQFIAAAEVGAKLKIKGTVKEHGTYNDLPETTVTRVTLI
jgi:hypothetical protein